MYILTLNVHFFSNVTYLFTDSVDQSYPNIVRNIEERGMISDKWTWVSYTESDYVHNGKLYANQDSFLAMNKHTSIASAKFSWIEGIICSSIENYEHQYNQLLKK